MHDKVGVNACNYASGERKTNEKAGESGLERRENPWRDWSCKEISVLESYARLKEKQPKK